MLLASPCEDYYAYTVVEEHITRLQAKHFTACKTWFPFKKDVNACKFVNSTPGSILKYSFDCT